MSTCCEYRSSMTSSARSLRAWPARSIGLGAGGIDGFIAGAEVGAEIADSGGLGVIDAIGAELIEDLPDDSAAVSLSSSIAGQSRFAPRSSTPAAKLIANRWVGVQELVRRALPCAQQPTEEGLIAPPPIAKVRRRQPRCRTYKPSSSARSTDVVTRIRIPTVIEPPARV